MRSFHLSILLLSLAFFCNVPTALSQAACDKDKSCIGSALTITQTSGRTAQYVDVDNSASIKALSTAMTFQAWIKPQAQAGKRQFIGGLWGPNKDNNDQWVLYIEDDVITFALSHDQLFRGNADNTVVTFRVPTLYTKGWTHIAAVFNGATSTASLYIDGTLAASGTNTQYPLTTLHVIENPTKLPMQIGSCNALNDDSVRYRTFLGQMDEIQLWNKVLTASEIQCGRLLSLNGNEAGLIMYFRCNEGANVQDLCDASNNSNTGKMRSGAQCLPSNRVPPLSFTVQPASVTETLFCTSDTTLTFTITDTTVCGSNVNISVAGRDASIFTPSVNNLTLVQNITQTFTVRVRATINGPIIAEIQIANSNRCGATFKIPLNYTRRTELDYSKTRIKFDTLYVGCQERNFAEDSITICNRAARPIRLDSLQMRRNIVTWRRDNGSAPLPTVLQPGECWKIYVRYNVSDTTKTERDTMRMFSDELCSGSGVIPFEARSQDVFILLNSTASRKIDSMKFEAVCPGQISNPQDYQYRNLVSEIIRIDTLFFTSTSFYGRRMGFPLVLQPNRAYQNEYVRFRPLAPGPVSGKLIARARYRGCTIEKKIELTGRGIDVNITFTPAVLSAGTVTVGKVSPPVNVTITNNGQDPRNLSIYLKVGDVFRVLSGRSIALNPGQSGNISIEFRPREPITYYDTLCVFDIQCFGTFCIPVSGTGVFQSVSFEPPFIGMNNVIGCKCRDDSVKVKNVTSSPLTITTATLSDPSGKMTMLSSPTGTLAPGATFIYKVRYCPNDLTDDRADRAYISLQLSDGQKYDVLVQANSLVPRLLVTDLTTFGTVEVGWQKTLRILVENVSAVPILVRSVTLPPGYTVLSYTPPLPDTLYPRDSLWVEVQFKPTLEQPYNGPISVSVDDPCTSTFVGQISGRGLVVKLDVPLTFINFGFVKPCDCPTREIPLPNNSQYIPITVDSVWIDGVGVPSPNPRVFLWRWSSGGTTLPHVIVPQTFDTLLLSFCPNVPATQANILSNAVVHIKARTPGWTQEFKTSMSGRREINFQPSIANVAFPTTVVDVNAPAQNFNLTVPDPFTNPSGDSIIVTGYKLVPDEGVFTVTAANGQPLPWIIRRNGTFGLRVNFKPRAPKAYSARLHLITSFPCTGADTTVLVTGAGNANAFGLQFAFDTSNIRRDTFRLTTCDTLVLPIMTNRAIPQSVMDVLFRLSYDTAALSLIDITSPYTPTILTKDTVGGKKVTISKARNVLAGTMATARFVGRGVSAAFPIRLDGVADRDEIEIVSDSLILYKFVVAKDEAYAILSQAKISITKLTQFDTVNVKFCKDLNMVVRNVGVVPVRFDSLPVPRMHRIISTSVPYPLVLQPNDSITFTVRFCPREEGVVDSTAQAYGSAPCIVTDSGRIYSYGYAPPFPMALGFDQDFTRIDTVRKTIADTTDIPIVVDRDVVQTPLDIRFTLDYNLRSLQYMSISSAYSPGITATPTPTGLRIDMPRCNDVKQGEIARLRFVFTVPDSILTRMTLTPLKFTSDSIFWVKPVVAGDVMMIQTDPRCNVSRLVFRGNLLNKMSPPVPNPAQNQVRVDVQFIGDANATMKLYNAQGNLAATLLDGKSRLPGGSYRLDFNTAELPSGVYMCVFQAGEFRDARQLVIVK